MKKFLIILSLAVFTGLVYSQSTSFPFQMNGGGSTSYIPSSGGGGTFDTSLSYIWTGSSNTFTGYVFPNGHMALNGSDALSFSATTPLDIYPMSGQTRSYMGVHTLTDGNGGIFILQDPSGTSAYYEIASGVLNIEGSGGSYVNTQIKSGSTVVQRWYPTHVSIPTILTNTTLVVTGNATFNGNSTFGDASGDTETHNAFVRTNPNGHYDDAAMYYPPDITGTSSNLYASAHFGGTVHMSSAGTTDSIVGTGTTFVMDGNNGSAIGQQKFRMTTSTNVLGSIAVVNTWFTNPTAQWADVKTGHQIPTGGVMEIWVASAGLTNKSIVANASTLVTWTNSTPSILLDPGASIIFTNIAGATVLDNQYSVTHYH